MNWFRPTASDFSATGIFSAVARGDLTVEEGARLLGELERRQGLLIAFSPLTAWRLVRKAWAWAAKR